MVEEFVKRKSNLKMKDINYSLTGKEGEKLKTTHKIGTFLFLAGILILINGFSLELLINLEFSIFLGFSLMILGSILFTFYSANQFKISSAFSKNTSVVQKIGLSLSLIGLGVLSIFWIGFKIEPLWLYLTISLGTILIGIILYSYGSYASHTAGIKNNHNTFNSLTSRGLIAWIISIALTLFYIQLYWYSDSLNSLVELFNSLSILFRGKNADQWFVYGTLYTFVIVFLGVKFMIKYRHSRYQLIRTIVVMFSQLVFAYFLPHILEGLNFNSATNDTGEFLGYFSANPVNSWPLNYEFFSSGHLKAYAQEAYQPIGLAYLIWGIILFLVITPVVTYYVGKRWYCSWFCGCGGLAETGGDAFRQLSSKSVKSWKIERWVVHSVLVFVLLMTIAIMLPFFSGKEFVVGFLSVNKLSFYLIVSVLLLVGFVILLRASRRFEKSKNILMAGSLIFLFVFIFLTIAFFTGNSNAFFIKSTSIKKAYGFFVGSVFSGVIGVGFYPILGNRVWCRFGCPMAAYMGLFQRFKSRFRITTNGGQCISCGNCSTYCEQGIDVRAYAQKGQNIVRSSCVGCGICSAVCPRGVLKLENGPEEGRIQDEPNLIGLLKE
jgi:Pyruvate/2-oxoacid:ferredoxin oxidoreductase delta subunit